MGGKHKQAQRTKNNARPSSSGRSAELLLSSPISQFTDVKESGLVLPGFSLVEREIVDTPIDTNFQLVFKKMNKKDSTTKLKALQEFAELVSSSEAEAVKAILLCWARLYGILATDTEHRVREAVHNAHYHVVVKSKKNLAPYLKQLIGPWFTSQYDTYPPAATAASKSFQAAFPPNKTESVIIFCQEQLLNYINDNLTVQTAQSLGNLKTITAEEADAKYERVIISSLQGYSLYLNTVSEEEIRNAAELNRNIISNVKFWKFANHKVTSIRATWFAVLSALCQKVLFLLEKEHGRVVSVVFNNLDESEPTVLPYIWEAALLIMGSITNWWNFIKIDKTLFPKLWKVLREGGQGNAAVIYPNLLPLISKLPPTVDANSFYNNFFENLRLGMKKKTVLDSKTEAVAVTTTLIECLQYVIFKNQSDVVLCEELIKNHLLATIEWSLTGNQTSYKTVFSETASIIQNWSRNRNQKELNNYSHFTLYFWTNLDLLMKSILGNLENNYDKSIVTDLTNKQIELLQSLKHTVKLKKQLKVQFLADNANIDKETENSNCDQKVLIDEQYFDDLNNLVYNISECYVILIEMKRLTILIQHLVSLIQHFDGQHLNYFNRIVNKNLHRPNLMDAFNMFFKWLKSDDLCSKSVVDLIFILFSNLDDNEKNHVLTSFWEISSDQCLGWCITKAFSHPYNQDEVIKIWLTTGQVTKYLIDITRKEINGDCPPELSILLKLVFTENQNGELLISKEAINEVVEILNLVLLHPNNYEMTIDYCSSLASHISCSIYSDNFKNNYCDSLLIALFTLSCNRRINFDTFSEDTLWEVNTSWQDGIISLSKVLNENELKNIIIKCANIFKNEFLSYSIDQETIDCLTEIIKNFIQSIFKGKPLLINETYNLFMNSELVPLWRQQITDVCMHAELLNGALCSPYDKLSSSEDDGINEMDIIKYFAWSYLKLVCLSTELDSNIDNDDDCDDVESKLGSKCTINALENGVNEIAYLLHDLSIIKSFLENYKTTKYIPEILNYYKLNIDKLKYLLNYVDQFDLKVKLIDNVSNEGWFWCKAVYLLYSELQPCNLIDVFEDFMKVLYPEHKLGCIHMIQLFGKHLTFDHVQGRFTYGTVDSVIILTSLLHCDEIDVQIAQICGHLDQIQHKDMPTYLFKNSNEAWKQGQETVEIIRLCCALIEKFQCNNRRYWDFSVVPLVSWAYNCFKAKQLNNKTVPALIIATSKLYSIVNKTILKLKDEQPNNNFIDEWETLFVQSIHSNLVQIWLYLAEQFEQKHNNLPLPYLPLLQDFGDVIRNFNYKFIFNNSGSLPKWSIFLKRCCSLMVSPVTALQLWGYEMLLILIPGLIDIDGVAVNTNRPHEKGLIFEQFKAVLVQTHNIVNDALMGFKLGEDSCQVKSFTDSFTYIFAYLLLWDVMLTLCEKSSTELRYQYTDWLRNEDLHKNLLNNLFRLMPTEVLHCNEAKVKLYQRLFLEKPNLCIKEPCTSEKLEHMVCWLYGKTLSQLPALVRQWWSSNETRVVQIVEKVTSLYVSAHLCNQELADVTRHETKFKNLVIKIAPSVREVIAIYTIDEAQMELVITLPPNYPLGGPDVHCNRQIGGTSHKQWLMQLKKCLLHQNGRIWDGLSLWNNNLDKKFDGVEECYICFAVLHPGTYQLPKLSCQTCKKKFHSACLYKWFSTSNKSSCPICRNLF